MMQSRRGYIEVDLGGALTSIECEGKYWTKRHTDLQAALTDAADMDLLEGAEGTVLGTVPIGIMPRLFTMTLPEAVSAAHLVDNGFLVTPMRSGATGVPLAAAS